MPVVGLTNHCVYCNRPFREGETVWVHPELGAICKPIPDEKCGATHSDPYRIPVASWREDVFSERFAA